MLTVDAGYIIERFGIKTIQSWVVEQQSNGDVLLRSPDGMEISVDPSYYTFTKDLDKLRYSLRDKHPRDVAIDMFGFKYGFFTYWTCSYHMLMECRPMADMNNSTIVFGFMP